MFKKILITALILVLIFAMLPPSAAWLAKYVAVDFPDFTASADNTAYFAGGDGSVDNPYIIANQTHLYNLAWLQYIGYFNAGETNNKRVQSYFVLNNNIDMDGFTLPPIGTTEYPFIGNFDGQGYIISNFTTANAQEAFSKRPNYSYFEVNSLLSNYDKSKAEAGAIIGFFGVVGDYNSTLDTLNNTALSGVGTITISDTAEVPTKDNDSDANKAIVYTNAIGIKNVGLNNYEVQASSTNTTIGVFAGYVNASISTVALCNCTVTASKTTAAFDTANLTSNISDYALIGYCTDNYSNVLNEIHTVIYDPKELEAGKHTIQDNTGDGTASGWGGSIAMNTLYTNLYNIVDGTNITNYVYKMNKFISAEPSMINPIYEDIATVDRLQNSTVGRTDQFSMVSTTGSGQFLYVSGGAVVYSYKYEYTDSNVTAYVIGYNGNYLNLSDDGQSLTTGTDASSATKWVFTEINRGNIYALCNGFRIYLNIGNTVGNSDNRSLSVSYDIPEFKLEFNNGSMICQYNNNIYRLSYTNSEWRFELLNENSYETNGYYITDGNGNYLSSDGTGITNETSSAEARIWTFSNLGGNTTTISLSDNSGYLRRNGTSIELSGTGTSWRGIDSNSLYERSGAFWSYTYYHVTFENDTWKIQQSDASSPPINVFFIPNLTVTVSGNIELTETTEKGTLIKRDVLMEYDANGHQNSTYIPLQMEADFTAKQGNTGYITSGMYDKVVNQGLEDDGMSDVRISRYSTDNIVTKSEVLTVVKVSNNDGTFSYKFQPLPVTDSSNNPVVDEDGNISSVLTDNDVFKAAQPQKYIDCVGKYYDLIYPASGSNLYGLHFMPSKINANSLVTINTAKINNKTYSNYQVPGDCIDFHLKERGYINFFAGNYYNGNDSFFSLHHVIREADGTPTDGVIKGPAIQQIKEINKIYGIPGDQSEKAIYIYEYENEPGLYYEYNFDDKLYTPRNDLPADFEMIFDMDWLRKSNTYDGWVDRNSSGNGEAYYFEVPVNAGEYALGSVDGGTGAYLLYLDISANAQENNRTIIYEKIEETKGTYNYAEGIFVKELDDVETPLATPFAEENEKFSLSITPGYTGSLTIDRADTAINYIPPAADNVRLNMASGVTVTNNGTSVTASPVNTVTTTTLRVTILDINLTTNVVTRYVFSKITTPGSDTIYKAERPGDDGVLIDATDDLIGTVSGDVMNINTTKKNDSINWAEVAASTTPAVDYKITYNDKSGTVDVNNTIALEHQSFATDDPPTSKYIIAVSTTANVELTVNVTEVSVGETGEGMTNISSVTINDTVADTDSTIEIPVPTG